MDFTGILILSHKIIVKPIGAKFKENLFLSEVVLARSLNFSKVQNITAILSQLATWKRVQLVIENLTKIPNSVYIAISSRGVIQFWYYWEI